MAQEWPSGWRTGRPIGWLAACLCVAAGLAGLPWIFHDRVFLGLAASAVVATLVLGLAAERALGRAPVRGGVGALAGIVVALSAHFGMALIYVTAAAMTGASASGRSVPGGVLDLTGLSLLVWGEVTVPLGAVAGVIAGGQIRLRHQRTAAAAQDHP
jgi:hypothetical protein